MEWIKNYTPKTLQEERDKKYLLHLASGLVGLSRNFPYHFTTSCIVVDPIKCSTLMIFHDIYQSWSWSGGHVEEGETLLSCALRELEEEAGLKKIEMVSEHPHGFEILPVKKHIRKGEEVQEHYHINFTFLLHAKEDSPLLENREKKVQWIPIETLSSFVKETHMLPIYKKYLDQYTPSSFHN